MASSPSNSIQLLGQILFVAGLTIFTALLGLDSYTLTSENLAVSRSYHKTAILSAATGEGMLDREYSSSSAFIRALKRSIKSAQADLAAQAANVGIPEGISEWDYKIGDWEIKNYILATVKQSGHGLVSRKPGLFLFLSIGLGILGGILFILPKFSGHPGIRNNHIYFAPMTRGLKMGPRAFFVLATVIGVLVYGIVYMGASFWPIISVAIIALIIGLVFYVQKSIKNSPARSASPTLTGWLGIFTGVYLIGFYILLYWFPEYITPWIKIVDPISNMLNGGPASRWFLYGFLYTIVVFVMGLRMIAKYRHNTYQIIRTLSVMFFQTAFAFLIPEILVRLNQPYFDFKNIWPLNYTFFFDWNLQSLTSSGGLGIFMLVWGIALIIIAVPVFTYFYGKRWYCSWVCGCGGLAETLGDPYRQLSDKGLRAWRFERWIIHGVLVFAIGMTVLTLYTYFSGNYQVAFLNSDSVRTWYGFLIGSAFAGIVGTGFYPLMGNRVWCRFGCPLAAYLGLVQRFRSRFRITVNGGQCMSCGNCSTYCEMGIDVRHYAQRGQDVVRASCVGCGICAAVCPRGVLRLENATADITQRTTELRTLHISDKEVRLVS